MKKPYIAILALMTAAAMSAQGLNKEITIEKEIVPEQRAATRLPVNHELITPHVKASVPEFSSTGVNAEITPGLTILDPALTGDSLVPSPYRGYAAAGYFPSYNLGASAGYRFIDNDRTRLGARLQFDGVSYKTTQDNGEQTLKDNALTLGVDLTQRVTDTGNLGVSLDFGYGKNSDEMESTMLDERSATRLRLSAGWKQTVSGVSYHIGAFGGLFNNSFGADKEKYNQSSFGGSVGAAFRGFSLDLTAQMLNNSAGDTAKPGNTVNHGNPGITDNTDNPGMVSVNPAWSYTREGVSLRLGFNAGFSINSGKTFVPAPDVRIDLRPNSYLGIYMVADGGVTVNSMESVYAISHFLQGDRYYGNSRVPLDVRTGVVIGPFRGASLELFGGYAKADDWLMLCHTYLSPADVKAWHGGVRLRYSWREMVLFKGSFHTAQSSGEKVYYLWRDGASTVVDLSAEVRPLKKLTLEAGWEYRTGRHSYDTQAGTIPQSLELGCVSNLRFGAAYRITDPLTVFARGENLLDRKWEISTDLPAQGISGLIGLSYKF
ncbi:MAG: hypothetical protein K2O00_09345 [Muribaculaceae bacterium]|nr:hypothetical protein [Muribaculaceae bacterium]